MLKLKSAIIQQLKNNIWSVMFLSAVLMCAFSCMLTTVSYTNAGVWQSDSVLKLLFTKNINSIALGNPTLSSDALIKVFPYSPWFSMLLITCAAFPAVTLFADEYYSGMFFFDISRVSVKKYSIVKYTSALGSGMLAFFFGFLVYRTIVILRFPGIEKYPKDVIESGETITGNERLCFIYGFVLHVAIVTAIFVAIVMLLTTFIKDRYFLFGIPMLVLFFTERLSIYVGSKNSAIYGEGNGWWNLAVLSNYINMYNTFEYNTGTRYYFFYVLAITEIIGIYVLFYIRIERRIKKNV